MTRNAAVSSAIMPANSHSERCPWEPVADRPPERIAAVAESAATTRYRDDPNAAKATSGNRSV